MARYTGPKLRLHRREGMDLFLKGILKTNPQAKAKEPRDYPPGQHGGARRIKVSNFGLQLREKQKLKRIYGVMEKQFRRYFKEAARNKAATGTELLRTLERRLDNAVYRSNFAVTRAQARQMVVHGAVLINDKKVDRPSFQVNVNDVIALHLTPERVKRIREAYEQLKDQSRTAWIEVNEKDLKSTVMRMPERSDINFPIEEQLVVELYSK